ncbi:MAG: hypothetical protein KA974_03470 [Saprospiraceae bacterium]|nr:hypothetical protein [Saprospiraceae bacterium]MBP7699725.1 hypothetical protein [Saprospiraceae bacterium]
MVCLVYTQFCTAQTTNSTCTITDIAIENISKCDNNNTRENYEDDFYTADLLITYSKKPKKGTLEISGTTTASVSVKKIKKRSARFKAVRMKAGKMNAPNISITAHFSDAPACKMTKKLGQGKQQCSTCPYPGGQINGTYQNCWPPEGENLRTCDDSFNYAPDPEHPERTPIKYVKVVMHVFQKENPNDPDNYTEAHCDVIKSYFHGKGGVNDFLANLCPAPDDSSPDYKDARFRLLNSGTLNYDVFFHPNNAGWGTSFYDCNTCPCGTCGGCKDCCTTCGPYRSTSLEEIKTQYLTGGYKGTGWHHSLTQEYIQTITSPEIRNAYHIFIARGRWRDCNGTTNDTIAIPDAADCYNMFPGGFTTPAFLQCENGAANPMPVALYYGHYEQYARMTNPNYVSFAPTVPLPATIPELGKGFVGELYHLLGIDHIGPLRAHWKHLNGDDGCADTPWDNDSNMMGCNFSGNPKVKCALTQCQLGKIHYLFENLHPAVQRFPTGSMETINAEGKFALTGNCEITMPDIIIKNGENCIWQSRRHLRSNVIVESGASLTIRCDIGLPDAGEIKVEDGGTLVVEQGVRVFKNCAEE